jgi:tetratricopeptide (TPR) repeat protein
MVPIEPIESLGRHVARQQRALLDPAAEHERLKANILRLATEGKGKRRNAPKLFGLAAALAAMAIAAFVFRPTARDLVYAVGDAKASSVVGTWMSAPKTQPLSISFSDGTRASLWPEARGRVTHLGPHGADVVVEQGRASFDVVHREHGHWQVSTGPFVVQVTGTRFDVEWQPEKDRFELNLYEGHVRVSGCALGDGQDVSAGQRIEASCVRHEYGVSALGARPAVSARPVAVASADAPHAGAKLAELRAELGRSPEQTPNQSRQLLAPLSASAGPAEASQRGPRPWAALAREGRFAEAYDTALSVGFEAACVSGTSSDVLLLGDSARLSSHIDRAQQAYQAVRRRWPGSNAAALAAFQIGRAEFDHLRNYAEAGRWLRAYLSEQPSGEFAAPALGRLMEAEVHLGHYGPAHELAKSYLNRYPNGAHADAAHQVLDASPATAH